MMLSVNEKKDLLNEKIEGLESALKSFYKDKEVAEFLVEFEGEKQQREIVWLDGLIEFSQKSLTKYKNYLEKLELE